MLKRVSMSAIFAASCTSHEAPVPVWEDSNPVN